MLALDRGAAQVAAKLFRGLGDPTRLSVLLALRAQEQRVTDLVERVGFSQATISAHLACLKGCGLITSRVEGRQNFYRIAHPELAGLLGSAERLLAAVGHDVQLCGHYEAIDVAGPAEETTTTWS